MRIAGLASLAGLIAAFALAANPPMAAQDAPANPPIDATPQILTGHPFTAIKYARLVRVLPDGKFRFLRTLRYPTRIARDSEGRLMMQVVHTDDLQPECDRLDLLAPPPCPAWGVFVIDPVAHMVTHWVEGELAGGGAVDFPLTPARLKEAADTTSRMPPLGPDFSDEDGKITRADLGNRNVEGILAHGLSWTLHYSANQEGRFVQRVRVHEVWTSKEMHLIVQVIDGDPNGEETVWGLEKISLSPDAALFRPPDGRIVQHRRSSRWGDGDFRDLKSWFEQQNSVPTQPDPPSQLGPNH